MIIKIDLRNLNLIEKTSSEFGNSAHVFVSKKLIGKNVKIIIGKFKLNSKKELKLDLFKSEILEREVSSFGTGAHVIIPKEYVNKKINLIFGGRNE